MFYITELDTCVLPDAPVLLTIDDELSSQETTLNSCAFEEEYSKVVDTQVSRLANEPSTLGWIKKVVKSVKKVVSSVAKAVRSVVSGIYKGIKCVIDFATDLVNKVVEFVKENWLLILIVILVIVVAYHVVPMLASGTEGLITVKAGAEAAASTKWTLASIKDLALAGTSMLSAAWGYIKQGASSVADWYKDNKEMVNSVAGYALAGWGAYEGLDYISDNWKDWLKNPYLWAVVGGVLVLYFWSKKPSVTLTNRGGQYV